MRKVTVTSSGRGRSKQTELLLDGEPISGQDSVQEPELEQDKHGDFKACLSAATRFLHYRPRSEFEVRQRLQRGFDSNVIAEVLAELEKKGMVNDLAFARAWVDDRSAFSPRSQRLIRVELKQRGIASDVIEQVIGATDDFDSACRAAETRSRTWSRADYEGFRRRLGEYLKRRGFNYGIIERAVDMAWRESCQTKPASLEDGNP